MLVVQGGQSPGRERLPNERSAGIEQGLIDDSAALAETLVPRDVRARGGAHIELKLPGFRSRDLAAPEFERADLRQFGGQIHRDAVGPRSPSA